MLSGAPAAARCSPRAGQHACHRGPSDQVADGEVECVPARVREVCISCPEHVHETAPEQRLNRDAHRCRGRPRSYPSRSFVCRVVEVRPPGYQEPRGPGRAERKHAGRESCLDDVEWQRYGPSEAGLRGMVEMMNVTVHAAAPSKAHPAMTPRQNRIDAQPRPACPFSGIAALPGGFMGQIMASGFCRMS